jgi:hypothetical protein
MNAYWCTSFAPANNVAFHTLLQQVGVIISIEEATCGTVSYTVTVMHSSQGICPLARYRLESRHSLNVGSNLQRHQQTMFHKINNNIIVFNKISQTISFFSQAPEPHKCRGSVVWLVVVGGLSSFKTRLRQRKKTLS